MSVMPDQIQVAYASETEQVELTLEYLEGESLGAAILRSGILERFPEIDLDENKTGIYGRLVGPEQVLIQGDRVEIYRSLKIDPKEARRLRASRDKT